MANNKYWLDRMENVQKLTNKQVTRRLKKLYQKANKRINKEVNNIWMQMLEDGEISSTNLYKGMRFSNLQNLIQSELVSLSRESGKYLSNVLLEVAKQGYFDMNTYVNKPTDFTIIDTQNAKQIIAQSYKGAVFSDRIWDNTTKLKGVIENKIVETTILGKDVRKASKELNTLMGGGFSQSKRIVVTETSRVYNESCRQKAQDNGYKTYHLLLEPDACEECVALEHEHFDINLSVLPVHPHCSCTLIIDLPELY